MTMHEKTSFWQNHLDGWKASGKDIRTFCNEHNIEEKQFHYWKRKLTQQEKDDFSQLFAEFIPGSGHTGKYSSKAKSTDNRLMLYVHGMKLYIPDGFNPEKLTCMLQVLK